MKTLQDFFTIYKQSAWDKDTESMIELYHTHVVIFDMWQKGFHSGLAEWSGVIKDWLGSLGEEKVRVIFERVETFESHTIGFGSALITYQAISEDNTMIRSMKNRITLAFVKEESVWKIRHQHTSAPINSDLQGILNF